MDYDIVVIGAGVVGLAISNELATRGYSVLVIEKNFTFGMDQSSRNSEVIHAGIYYNTGSLKAKLCVEGRRLLYQHCDKYQVPYKKIGKYIFAVNQDEESKMLKLLNKGIENGVENFYQDNVANMKSKNPGIKAAACLYSAESGIINSHILMESFIENLKNNDGDIVYNHKVVAIENNSSLYKVFVEMNDETFSIESKYVINCAGLYSDQIAEIIGIDIVKEDLNIQFCKGRYYKIHSSKSGIASNLIYPIPPDNFAGLGIHLTIDMAGGLKLGPDTLYLEQNILDYKVEEDVLKKFYLAEQSYIESIKIEDLSPDQSGIRAKLQKDGQAIKDFYIKEESKRGYPNFINLIGIESPGLTSSIAIAKYVSKMIQETI